MSKSHQRSLDNLTGYGYMNVVPTGAVIAADSTSESVGEAKAYPLTLTYQAGTAEALKIIVTVNVLNDLPQYLIEIPEAIALTREGNAAYAEATESIRLLTGADEVLTDSQQNIKVLTDRNFYIYSEEEAKNEGLLANVYKLDAENNQTAHSGGTTPLAVLSPQTTEQTFKLISGSVKNLKYKNYTGSMNYTISYGDSN